VKPLIFNLSKKFEDSQSERLKSSRLKDDSLSFQWGSLTWILTTTLPLRRIVTYKGCQNSEFPKQRKPGKSSASTK